MTEIKKTYCRICPGFCAVDVTIEDGRAVDVRGDRNDPVTRGYTCIKGVQNTDLLYGQGRFRQSMRRDASGALAPVELDDALDQIAARLKAIVDQHGPRAVGIFLGTQAWFSAVNAPAATAFAAALDTPCLFGTMTIDQSAKWVASERIGVFNGGPQRFDQADVWMLIGTNPLVSVMGGPSTSGFGHTNPTKTLRDARVRGMKLIVIDPRRTETALQADLFLQPRPGEDAALLAGIVHVVLREKWYDQAFCDRHVDGIAQLRAALAPFTPEAAARRADVNADDIVAAARIFAQQGRRGMAGSGTGPNMGPHSNIAEHLVQCLNVLCGRYLREGDEVPNPGVLQPFVARHADVSPPKRSWLTGPRSRRLGLGRIFGQMMSAELADEILLEGSGQIKALICLGGNPAVALPDQAKAIAALGALELLVTIDPRLSATAKLADYVIAPTLAFERHDHTGFLEAMFQQPYARYATPVVAAPAGSQLIDDWKFFWEIARRMGGPMQLGNLVCSAAPAPSTEEVLAAIALGSRVPLDEVRAQPAGAIFDAGKIFVQPPRPEWTDKLELAAADVLDEIAAVAATLEQASAPGLLLTVRRVREFVNSGLTDAAKSRARIPDNPAFLHPDDFAQLGLTDGEKVAVVSATGRVTAIARCDPTLRRGMVSVTHCWGAGSDDEHQIPESTSRLVASDTGYQSINGMPIMTAIPVEVLRLG
ncbi:molybdopterin-containing oxidoreductase family protein [Massilia cavernae]|uniref:4Fe-4S Mo/W bis-MGD-type domain-containing protein n=1 Tax=Massilia cavernae TaxID=2320864 RepID=A0A418Y0R0_9BURK|nr:molybdopterin-dependent oxidoreductase [Massilia cavernae]RJG18914.1 hypothetical protein D3872_09535 [Massilia cavernae]